MEEKPPKKNSRYNSFMGRGGNQKKQKYFLDSKEVLFHSSLLGKNNDDKPETKLPKDDSKQEKIEKLKVTAAKILNDPEKKISDIFPELLGLPLETVQKSLSDSYQITNRAVLTRDYKPYRIQVETKTESNQEIIIQVVKNG